MKRIHTTLQPGTDIERAMPNVDGIPMAKPFCECGMCVRVLDKATIDRQAAATAAPGIALFLIGGQLIGFDVAGVPTPRSARQRRSSKHGHGTPG